MNTTNSNLCKQIRNNGFNREDIYGNPIQLWSEEEKIEKNILYETDKYLKKFILIGSDGCGEAFTLKINSEGVYKVPFIGMTDTLAEKIAESYEAFVSTLKYNTDKKSPNEIVQIHPVILGGDPVSKNNIDTIPLEKHSKIVNFWNKIIKSNSSKK